MLAGWMGIAVMPGIVVPPEPATGATAASAMGATAAPAVEATAGAQPRPSGDGGRVRPFWLPAWQRSEPETSTVPPESVSAGLPSNYPVVSPGLAVARAAGWLTASNGGPVPYSMSRCFPGFTPTYCVAPKYRTDCSGFVSMALGLPTSLVTGDMVKPWFSTPLTRDQLQRGDILVNPSPGGNGHVVLFDRWDGIDHSRYFAYEQSGDGGTHYRSIPYPYFDGYPMSPYRYHNLLTSPAPDAGSTVTYRDELHVVSRAADGSVIHNWRRNGIWNTENLGGIVEGRVSVAVYAGGFHVIGARAGVVYQKWFDGTAWTGWAPVASGDDPYAITYHDEFHIVSRARDGSTRNTWYDGRSWTSQNLGGILSGRLLAAEYRGGLHLVGAINGTVYQKWFNGSAWFDWRPVAVGADPVPLVYRDEFHLVSRAGNASVQHSWYDGRSWHALNMGGIITGAPTSTVYKGGFYLVGANYGTVYQRWFTGAFWTDWTPISTGGSPTVTAFQFGDTNQYQVFSRWADGSLINSWYNGGYWTTQNLPG